MIVLVLIESSDLIFAVDSIPAVFGITHDPFLVWTSNIAAILGLRAMYFLLADVVRRYAYLKPALAAVLVFVGVKMLIGAWLVIPTWVSLAVILSLLGCGVAATWVVDAWRLVRR